MKQRKKQSGFTLIELAIVLAIAAAVIYVGFAVVPSLLASNKSNAETSALPAIVAKIQKNYATQPNFAGVTTAGLIGLDVFPPEYVNGAALADRWGGTITPAVATIVTASDGIALTYTNIPQQECVDVAVGMERTMRIISVGGTVVKADGGVLNRTTLGTQCNNATNTMVFTFGR
ncbi:prepilin-type N-terminal cleavage/methylation domain-containing protein [Paraburkholderia sp. UCT31]|uniref:type 4 pilus major pilin n=1 Tax=Paraburkholderia sp. UCT31 TaxID=2615209 RepID=UPI0016555092|nr:type 4 pilus major pilin [Paraburkholderia sp. UCT31]MBC8737281.1 prepilin-type N-terminal cleavage/methylation domain-containing protein [Paraburkholderia sp. UCT31]